MKFCHEPKCQNTMLIKPKRMFLLSTRLTYLKEFEKILLKKKVFLPRSGDDVIINFNKLQSINEKKWV
jgi:hypothetical protein